MKCPLRSCYTAADLRSKTNVTFTYGFMSKSPVTISMLSHEPEQQVVHPVIESEIIPFQTCPANISPYVSILVTHLANKSNRANN